MRREETEIELPQLIRKASQVKRDRSRELRLPFSTGAFAGLDPPVQSADVLFRGYAERRFSARQRSVEARLPSPGAGMKLSIPCVFFSLMTPSTSPSSTQG